MKLAVVLFAVLGLAVAQLQVTSFSTQSSLNSHAFVVLSQSEYSHSSLISSLLSFGATSVLSTATSCQYFQSQSQQLFAASDFQLATIREVAWWSSESFALYRFNLRYVHSRISNVFVDTRFTVKYLLSGFDTSVASFLSRTSVVFSDYSFGLDECDALRSQYLALPLNQCYYNTPTWQWLGYGNNYITFLGHLRGQLGRLATSITSLNVQTINSISVRSSDNLHFYSYNVLFSDIRQSIYNVQASFIVAVSHHSSLFAVVSTNYNVVDLINKHECGCPNYSDDNNSDWHDWSEFSAGSISSSSSSSSDDHHESSTYHHSHHHHLSESWVNSRN